MPTMPTVLLETNLDAPRYRGKVRDTYDLGDRLLIVATDRVSALDTVLPTGIPRKGEVLTRLSAWWFDRTKEVIPSHFIALLTPENAGDLPFPVPAELFGRSMIVRKAKRFDVECIARGYLAGSGWKDYQATGSICGIPLEEGLQEAQRLPEAIFTPTSKASEGHDLPITYQELEAEVGEETANVMRLRTLALYGYAHTVAAERGLLIADTKFEFGLWNDEIILIDEVLTPDSSRFWPLKEYVPGRPQPSFDKQPIRDWLAASKWAEGKAPPEIPDEIVAATTQRYLEVYKMLTGEALPE
jgi:phosphoribosylaminoimidazole-succinocarboxamide synthase